jgi:hypothetical protein
LTTHGTAVDQTLQLAQKGVGAVEMMDSARRRAGGLDLFGARADARTARDVFAQLGDTTRATQAGELVTDVSRYSVYLGVGVLAAGLGAVAAGTVVGVRRRRGTNRSTRRSSAQIPGKPGTIGKESAEWL